MNEFTYFDEWNTLIIRSVIKRLNLIESFRNPGDLSEHNLIFLNKEKGKQIYVQIRLLGLWLVPLLSSPLAVLHSLYLLKTSK
jgi:hypothetical protein